jgi:hypothetical protein
MPISLTHFSTRYLFLFYYDSAWILDGQRQCHHGRGRGCGSVVGPWRSLFLWAIAMYISNSRVSEDDSVK